MSDEKNHVESALKFFLIIIVVIVCGLISMTGWGASVAVPAAFILSRQIWKG